MNEYLGYILGTLSVAWYFAAFTFNFIGMFIRWALTAYNGVKSNPVSPPKFSWSYWWYNNGKKELINLLLIVAMVFVILRFCTEWLNVAPSMAIACGLGLAVDLLKYFFRKKIKGDGLPIKPEEKP